MFNTDLFSLSFSLPRPRRALTALAGLATLALAGCYTVDQPRLNSFANQTVTAGMPLDQALVRMAVEGFNCQKDGASSAMLCTRDQRTLLRAVCVERVDLKTGGGKMVTAVEVAPVACGKNFVTM
ncbi:hypothetical protein [Rugamonas sp.]|uniref:hypothetical protein n=1 Tax=Rugamonas sp. TaxID=1926287 RepID=UPI0025F02F5D|nr:hypothetical protein [Rugamonas sp.]